MKNTSPKLVIALACFAFLIYGLFNSAIGPVIDELAALTGSSLAAVGGVFSFLFAGSLTSMLVVGPIIDRVGKKYVMVVALIVLAAGIFGFSNVRLLPLMFAMFLITGFGQGGMEISGSLVVTDASPKENTGILNLLHFFFGLGAFLGPALVSLSLSLGASGRMVQWLAAGAYALLAFLFLLFYKNNPRQQHPPLVESAPVEQAIYRSPLLWTMGALLLFYVGVEYSIGSWTTNFMGMSAGLPIEKGALVASAYWGCLTLGRLLGIVLSKKLTTLQLLGTSIFGALLGGAGFLLLTGTRAPVIAVIMLIGFFFGAIFPTTISLATKAFPNSQGKAVSLVSAMSSIGGLTLPWLAGVLLEQGGAGVFSAYVGSVLAVLALLYVVIRRFWKNKAYNS